MVTLGVGGGADLVTGDRRKADGEGIVIVAIELKMGHQAMTEKIEDLIVMNSKV